MEISARDLRERYASITTEALADLYHEGLTDLAASVLKDEITSRGLDWVTFTSPRRTEPASHSAWELWKSESQKEADRVRSEPIATKEEAGVGSRLFSFGLAAFGLFIFGSEAIDIYRIGTWHHVRGAVESVSKEYYCCDGGHTDVEIYYSYTVGGITYRKMNSETVILLPTPDYARREPITVYYDANSPQNSIIDFGVWHRVVDVASSLFLIAWGWTGVWFQSRGDCN